MNKQISHAQSTSADITSLPYETQMYSFIRENSLKNVYSIQRAGVTLKEQLGGQYIIQTRNDKENKETIRKY